MHLSSSTDNVRTDGALMGPAAVFARDRKCANTNFAIMKLQKTTFTVPSAWRARAWPRQLLLWLVELSMRSHLLSSTRCTAAYIESVVNRRNWSPRVRIHRKKRKRLHSEGKRILTFTFVVCAFFSLFGFSFLHFGWIRSHSDKCLCCNRSHSHILPVHTAIRRNFYGG